MQAADINRVVRQLPLFEPSPPLFLLNLVCSPCRDCGPQSLWHDRRPVRAAAQLQMLPTVRMVIEACKRA